ncbi:MAG TPA: TetR/AcrR family transcriptional regulator [Acidimicrobiales bacterium]|nr:TetR/AcrR family transcriptional regulator [Acidimicrobiales bacterium]HKH24542.1 TetR/AcrR family transcriptional regulator [Acidimicrobiales bacterium]
MTPPDGVEAPSGTRLRIIEAAYACVARDGIAKTTLEAAAQEANVARATVYRYFPGGRDELFGAVVAWEVERFFAGVRVDVGDVPDFATYLERGLLAARRRFTEHTLLQDLLAGEAEMLVPPLVEVMPLVVNLLAADLALRLKRERLRPGVDPEVAGDLLARMTLSHMGTPGVWDLDAPGEARRLVREWWLAGVLAD